MGDNDPNASLLANASIQGGASPRVPTGADVETGLSPGSSSSAPSSATGENGGSAADGKHTGETGAEDGATGEADGFMAKMANGGWRRYCQGKNAIVAFYSLGLLFSAVGNSIFFKKVSGSAVGMHAVQCTLSMLSSIR
jgi:hypothetical protein